MRQLEQQMTVHGTSPYTLTFGEAPGQVFEVGVPLTLNAAGQVQEAASPAATVLGVSAGYATGITDNPQTVWIADEDTLFGVVMVGAIESDRGKLVTVRKVGAIWSADRATVGTFQVMEIGTSLPPGQMIARGRFMQSATQMWKAA